MATDDNASTATHRGTGIRSSYIVAAIIAAALLALVVQNDHDVHFEWLWLDFQASLAVMLLLTAFFTMLATSLLGLVWRARRRRALDDPDHPDHEAGHGRRMRPRVG